MTWPRDRIPTDGTRGSLLNRRTWRRPSPPLPGLIGTNKMRRCPQPWMGAAKNTTRQNRRSVRPIRTPPPHVVLRMKSSAAFEHFSLNLSGQRAVSPVALSQFGSGGAKVNSRCLLYCLQGAYRHCSCPKRQGHRAAMSAPPSAASGGAIEFAKRARLFNRSSRWPKPCDPDRSFRRLTLRFRLRSEATAGQAATGTAQRAIPTKTR